MSPILLVGKQKFIEKGIRSRREPDPSIPIQPCFFFFFSVLFFFRSLFIHERHTEAETQRERQAPCGEPDAGLNLRTPGSQPEPKADTQPPRCPKPPGFYLWVLGTAGENIGCSEPRAQGSLFPEAYLSFRPVLSQKALLS